MGLQFYLIAKTHIGELALLLPKYPTFYILYLYVSCAARYFGNLSSNNYTETLQCRCKVTAQTTFVYLVYVYLSVRAVIFNQAFRINDVRESLTLWIYAAPE